MARDPWRLALGGPRILARRTFCALYTSASSSSEASQRRRRDARGTGKGRRDRRLSEANLLPGRQFADRATHLAVLSASGTNPYTRFVGLVTDLSARKKAKVAFRATLSAKVARWRI